jgi:type VI secretion system protein ImpA
MIQIDTLLQPIDDAHPSGHDLRLEPGDLTFERLRELRTAVDPALDESGEGREPDWRSAIELCEQVLREQSKDLEVVVALAEAVVRSEGLPELAGVVELLRRTLESYWDTLHPGYDAEDGAISLPLRARWLAWLDSAKGFIAAVKQAPLAVSAAGPARCWRDHEMSETVDDISLSAERRQELSEAGYISGAQWKASLAAIPEAQLQDAASSLARSADELRAIDSFCRERFDAQGEDAPDFVNLISLLDSIREYLEERLGGAAVQSGSEYETAPAALSTPGSPTAHGPIASRQQALRQLQEVADFFRRSEPHSPISYLIARAVKWGGMPLDQLFRDVVRDDAVIGHIWETLGLDVREDTGSGEE